MQDTFERTIAEYSEFTRQVTGGQLDRTRFVIWDLTPVTFADSMGLHLVGGAIARQRPRLHPS